MYDLGQLAFTWRAPEPARLREPLSATQIVRLHKAILVVAPATRRRLVPQLRLPGDPPMPGAITPGSLNQAQAEWIIHRLARHRAP